MVWIKWDDYKKTKKRTQPKKKKSTKPRIEPRSKIIPGKHKVEFRKASELLDD
ncbi:MAG TPA: hypothetical protein VLF17_06600 [Candidatus Nitrosotenuis sp.]|nr:hypothetical protein [Candidatus Nitrosotenuis sp.]